MAELPEPDPIAEIMPTPAAPTEEVFSLAAEAEPVAPTEPAAAPAPVIDVPVEMRGEDIFIQQGDRRYRVRGLAKNMSYELLKVNVLVLGHDAARGIGLPRGHVRSLRRAAAHGLHKQAAEELGIKEEMIRRDLGQVLMKLEEMRTSRSRRRLRRRSRKSS